MREIAISDAIGTEKVLFLLEANWTFKAILAHVLVWPMNYIEFVGFWLVGVKPVHQISGRWVFGKGCIASLRQDWRFGYRGLLSSQ